MKAFFDFMNNGLLKTIAEGGLKNPTTYYVLVLVFAVLSIGVAYLLGSLNTAIIVSRLLYNDDVRNHGSKNAGLTNMLRTYGKKGALLTLGGDILKTVIAITFCAVFFGFNSNK